MWLPLKWAGNIKQALYVRADDKINAAATRIQNRARAVAARERATAKRQSHLFAFRALVKRNAAVAIQKRLARGPAARAATAWLATGAFKKYAVDSDELLQYATSTLKGRDAVRANQSHVCYWAFVGLWSGMLDSSRTSRFTKRAHKHIVSRVAWVKPKLLRDTDVKRISQRPTKRTAFVVDCAFCGICAAEKVCLDACADPYKHTASRYYSKRTPFLH